MPINPACYNTNTLTTTSVVEENPEGSGLWRSVCSCSLVTCEAGTYEEAVAALDVHRPGPWPS